ncbi:MAG: DUF559 domain-containing protein [Nitrospiraceae bacterium]|nr:MAG: DUF559 domain-containing protein [Nitrospiraceae bacterium]
MAESAINPNNSNEQLIRERAVHLFTYLKEVAQLRTKVVRDCSDYEDIVWFNDIPKEKGCYTVAWGAKSEDDNVWIEIRKQKEPPCPGIPPICSDWLDAKSVFDSSNAPQLYDRIPKFTSEDNDEYVYLKDKPEVMEAWQKYLRAWHPWAAEHKRWKSVHFVYGKLFSMYHQQKRLGEAYELILGLGLLVWITPAGQRIRRHILAGLSNISFDADTGVIRVGPSSDGTALSIETDMFEPSERPVAEIEQALEESLKETSETPWDRNLVEPIIRSWINAIDSKGSYEERIDPIKEFARTARSNFAPALILRKRTARNLVSSFNKIITQILQGINIPFNIKRICEITNDRTIIEDSQDTTNGQRKMPDEIYFPLPSNEEQYQIVKSLASNQGILVQGPPGTGKSHTIANLICHLLATGKRVLITSQTPRALKVLSKKVPGDILPLCVSVLGNDISSLQNLEFSVRTITENYNVWNSEKNEKNISKIEEHLYFLKMKKADKERALRELREIETYKHTVAEGTYIGTAQTIAIRLNEKASQYNWFLDDIQENVSIPFDIVVFRKLLKAYREFPETRCKEILRPLIKSRDLPTVDEFLHLIRNETEKHEILMKYEPRKSNSAYPTLSKTDKYSRLHLEESLKDLIVAISDIRNRALPWIHRAVEEVLSEHQQTWQTLFDTTKKYLDDIQGKIKEVDMLSVSLPVNTDCQQVKADAEDLFKYLNSGGKLGWWIFRNKIVKRTCYIIKSVRINGRPCDNPNLLSDLICYFHIKNTLEIIWNNWGNLTEPLKTSFTLQISEINEHLEALNTILSLVEPLEKAKNAITEIEGLSIPKWHDYHEINNLLEDVYAVNAEVDYLLAKLSIEQFCKQVEAVTANPNCHLANREILNAINKRDGEAYKKALYNLKTTIEQISQITEKKELHNVLHSIAPKFAETLEATAASPEWDERIQRIEDAWHWAQANSWLNKFHEEHKDKNLKEELSFIEASIRKKTEEAAALKSWHHCFKRMTEEQRQHLIAWSQAVKRIGKGKGKHAERHRRDAQFHLEKAREAIPAWVMPFYRVAETVAPIPEIFDVVIVDEASQSGPESLLLLYLAKQCIIVGDDQQISPDAVGINQDDINLFAARYLSDIPHADSLGVNSSLFGQGEIRFGGRIILREHFRCMPEIIRFSNDLCYPATPLKPLRQYPPDRLEPIVTKYVRNGFREGGTRAINKPEAEVLADAVRTCCENSAYDGKSMGVISLQGEEQAYLVEKLLMDRIGAEEIDKRGLVCGDAYDFQGDERDIIFLSMVAAPNERIGALVKESDKRRFNVAASRARDQLWLFHSSTLNDLNPNCMRYKLLDYCLERKPIQPHIDETVFDSQFERDVYGQITVRGYRVIPQFKVAHYKIDLVVEGMKNRLAVECDGDEWHGSESFYADMHRQRILERCGWTFWRIRGSEYYRNPEKAMISLWQKLDTLGIKPDFCDSRYTSSSKEEAKSYSSEESTSQEESFEEKPDKATQGKSTYQKEAHHENVDEDLLWVSKIDAKIWYKLAHWSKIQGQFKPDERNHLFNIGKKLSHKAQLYPNQVKKARRLFERAIQLGFNS